VTPSEIQKEIAVSAAGCESGMQALGRDRRDFSWQRIPALRETLNNSAVPLFCLHTDNHKT
jgi:hypothetical protein